jgi:hypothetical protein
MQVLNQEETITKPTTISNYIYYMERKQIEQD